MKDAVHTEVLTCLEKQTRHQTIILTKLNSMLNRQLKQGWYRTEQICKIHQFSKLLTCSPQLLSWLVKRIKKKKSLTSFQI